MRTVSIHSIHLCLISHGSLQQTISSSFCFLWPVPCPTVGHPWPPSLRALAPLCHRGPQSTSPALQLPGLGFFLVRRVWKGCHVYALKFWGEILGRSSQVLARGGAVPPPPGLQSRQELAVTGPGWLMATSGAPAQQPRCHHRASSPVGGTRTKPAQECGVSRTHIPVGSGVGRRRGKFHPA